jgi:hypothetical protein
MNRQIEFINVRNIHKRMKRTTIFAINNTLCNSIKVANLVLCSIVLFGSLMCIETRRNIWYDII